MSLIETLAEKGFEIVEGEDGEQLVKMLFSAGDDNVTACAYVPPYIANRVLNGELTPNLDEEGKTVVSFEEVVPEESTLPQKQEVPDQPSNEEEVNGQKYTLIEETSVIDDKEVQIVSLQDALGNVLDQKQGQAGEQVLIEMNGHSLQYIFLGPTKDGQPCETTIVVTTEVGEGNEIAVADEEETEAGITAADWCPIGLSPDVYTVLRRQTEVVVQARCPPSANGKPLFSSHIRSGTANAREINDVISSYKIGASKGESLEKYEVLRGLSAVYRFSGSNPRVLTKHEAAINEAAAQICRFHPSILWNKPELFRLAKESVELCQMSLEQAGYVDALSSTVQADSDSPKPPSPTQHQQPSNQNQAQQLAGQGHGGQATNEQPSHTGLTNRVASNQLAMLESRGLEKVASGMAHHGKHAEGQLGTNTTTTVSSVVSNMGNKKLDDPLHARDIQESAKGPQQTNAQGMVYGEQLEHGSMGVNKRDYSEKLNSPELEALRSRAIDLLTTLGRYEVKPKCDCTNIERASWDIAAEFASVGMSTKELTDEHAISQLLNSGRLEAVRESAALYGRNPFSCVSVGLPRSTNLSFLTPFELACNEAAALLCAGQPALLTNRSDLSELAKKIVRTCGLTFPHAPLMDKTAVPGGYRFYCGDQVPMLDLSAAENTLLNPVDEIDEEPMADSLSDSSGDCNSLLLSCEEGCNYLDDIVISIHTGTDSLKRVRILDVSNQLFTGVVPMYVNQCVNLVELNLSGNSLRALPRCLYLSKLKRLVLTGNTLMTKAALKDRSKLPLVEQFPKLQTLEVDKELVPLFEMQALAYLCPNLKSINDMELELEPTKETIHVVVVAKTSLSTLVHSKWEDDINCFYKKGVPKRQVSRIIETLVMHTQTRSATIGSPFTHCKDVLARRIAEEFISPKIIEHEDEDDPAASINRRHLCSGDDSAAGGGDVADNDSSVDDHSSSESDNNATAVGDDQEYDTTNGNKQVNKRRRKSLAREASVAAREAEAAAKSLTLLPEEPVDRLSGVVGQAIRQGKTIVYSVMRSAARQPNGELIPVGHSNTSGKAMKENSQGMSRRSVFCVDEDEWASDVENQPIVEQVPASQVHQNLSASTNMQSQQHIQPHEQSQLMPPPNGSQHHPGMVHQSSAMMAATAHHNTHSASRKEHHNRTHSNNRHHHHGKQHSRESHHSNRHHLPAHAAQALAQQAAIGKRRSPIISTEKHFSDDIYPIDEENDDSNANGRRATMGLPAALMGGTAASNYPGGAAALRNASAQQLQAALKTGFVLDDGQKTHGTWQPGKRGRPPGSVSKNKSQPKEPELDTEELKKSMELPKPLSKLDTDEKRMATRDSNRNKRFSAYGVIDTEAARLGKEEALIVAKFAYDDEEESENYKHIMGEDNRFAKPRATGTGRKRGKRPKGPRLANDDEDGDYQISDEEEDDEESIPPDEDMNAVDQEEEYIPAQLKQTQAKQNVHEAPHMVASSSMTPMDVSKPSTSVSRSVDSSVTPTKRSRPIEISTPSVAAKEIVSNRQLPSTRRSAGLNSGNMYSSGKEVKNGAIAYFAEKYGSVDELKCIVESAADYDRTVSGPSLSKLGRYVDYDPLHFIRCHARNNDPTDSHTKVWRCVFEPDVFSPDKRTTNTIATCGGECVCLIDCESGKVMKRFKHISEEFFTIAWTTIKMHSGQRTNLLAAAGKLKEIRLLHPDQLVCYAEMRGHKEDVSCLTFHPERPTILFSGDSKAMILVWDIGIPSAPDYRTKHVLLTRLICPRPELNPVLNLVVLPRYDAVIAGCEDGVFSWTLVDFKKDRASVERQADIEIKVPTRKEPCFDGLTKLSENLIVVKCVEEGELYLIDYGTLCLRLVERNFSLSRPVPVEVIGQARWQKTDEIYINVTARQGISVITCGDNEGTIWLYDMQNQVKNVGALTKFKAKPVKILDWPDCSVGEPKEQSSKYESIESGLRNPVVNTTDISWDGKFLVAVTDNNLVCIWKFSGSPSYDTRFKEKNL